MKDYQNLFISRDPNYPWNANNIIPESLLKYI
jgi:hypothetical protein